jgi:cytochrome c-type biogenesis protein CcmH
VSRSTRLAIWVGLALVLVTALAIGANRASTPSTNAERIDNIARTIKCPSCRSESVFESKAPSAEAIRNEIARQVGAGRTDDQVRDSIAGSFGRDLLLVPSTEGISSLVWILPVVALVLAVAGLAFAFHRWKVNGQARPVSEADRELVAAALAIEHQAASGAAAPSGPVTRAASTPAVDTHGEGDGR